MARHDEVDSATASFFINLSDNEHLDHVGDSPDEFGYCVFGKVVKGMDVVDSIASVETAATTNDNNIPVVPVFITKVSISAG